MNETFISSSKMSTIYVMNLYKFQLFSFSEVTENNIKMLLEINNQTSDSSFTNESNKFLNTKLTN